MLGWAVGLQPPVLFSHNKFGIMQTESRLPISRIMSACLSQQKATFSNLGCSCPPHPIKLISSGLRLRLCFLWTDSSDASGGEVRKNPEQAVVDICACPGRVTKRQSAHCYSNNRRQQPTRDQFPLRGGGGRCHAPCGLRHIEPRLGRIWHDPDVSSRFRRPLLASRATNATRCLFHRACARLRWRFVGGGVHLAFCKQKNVAPFSIIPQGQASLDGMLQQKLGHCGF